MAASTTLVSFRCLNGFFSCHYHFVLFQKLLWLLNAINCVKSSLNGLAQPTAQVIPSTEKLLFEPAAAPFGFGLDLFYFIAL
jgi:hypothetical protein